MNKLIKSCLSLVVMALLGIGLIYLAMVYDSGINKQTLEPVVSLDASKLVQLGNIMPVVIIGSGPAGLAAGVYTRRAGLQTLIIEGKKPGGLLTETTYIENWPAESKILGKDLMYKFKQQNIDLGVQFLTDVVNKVDFATWPYQIHTVDGLQINALSVIIATGAQPRRLGVVGEEQYWSHGVSSCAVCDAPFYKDRQVVVCGGGDSAAEQVLQLAPHVQGVTMLVRAEKMRACKNMQEKVAAIANAKILFNREIKKIDGDGDKVTTISLLNNKTNELEKLSIDGIFLAIGHDPATNIFKGQLAMDDSGYLRLKNGTQTTSIAGVFAAGEVVDYTYRQAGVAAGDGIKAALESVSFLQSLGFNNEFDKKIEASYFTIQKSKSSVLKTIKTLAEFDEHVIKGSLPSVLDFYTNYCSACIHMLPYYEAAAYELEGKINCFKIDADEAEELVRKLNVSRVPTILVYQNGQQVLKTQQTFTKREMLDLLSKYIS